MRKILFPILILLIKLSMSDCKEEGNGEGKGKETYYTVTYHKYEETIGEPPFDNNKYKPTTLNVDFTRSKLEEITAQITVFILLELKSSPCITSTGRSLADSDPRADGK